jgi:hypothetical protein
MEDNNTTSLIIKTLRDKAVLKQQIYQKGKAGFECMQSVVETMYNTLYEELKEQKEPEVRLQFQRRGEFECSFTFGGDTLIFHLHTNVFQFERSHPIWQTGYLRDDEKRSFCMVINVYNFLYDSLAYNRGGDIGYLIARIFINIDGNFFVEGKRQLGLLYNNFHQQKVCDGEMRKVLESALLYTIDFDLLMPTYERVKAVTVEEIHATSSILTQKTGKRLGFRFQADQESDMF